MEFNNYIIQDFDEDLGLVLPGDRGAAPKTVPTFYRDVYVTNERLDFQNKHSQQQAFDFNSDQPINIKNVVSQKYQSDKPTKSKSTKRLGSSSLSRKKRTQIQRIPKKQRSFKVYNKSPWQKRKPEQQQYQQHQQRQQHQHLKENRDWNRDTRTVGFFDPRLKKQLISYPGKQREEPIPEEAYERSGRDVHRGRTTVVSGPHVHEHGEGKKFFTDLDDFTQKILEDAQSVPQKSSPRGERAKKSTKKVTIVERTHSNPLKRDISPGEIVEKIAREQEDNEGKPNPYFVRKAREMLQGKGNSNKFFVSMSVKRDQINQDDDNHIRRNRKMDHVQPKLLERTASFIAKTKQGSRGGRRSKSPLEKVYNKDRAIQQQHKIYSDDHEIEYIKRSKVVDDLDLVPTKEDGTKSIKDMRSYSAKPRTVQNNVDNQMRGGQHHEYVTQGSQKNYVYEDMDQVRRQEIESRVEADHVLRDYKTRLEERTQEPNVYFDRISRGLEDLKRNFGAVSQDLEQTSTYMKNKMKKSQGNYKLLALGAGKLVKLYSEKLVEMLLDDMILETIPILHEKEENEARLERKRKKKEILKDCLESLKDLAFEQKKVHDRAEEIYTLTAVTRNRMKTLEREPGAGQINKVLKRRVEMSQPQVKIIQESKEKYKQFRKTNELFLEKTHIMMDILARNLLDDLTKEVIQQFLHAQEEFVEKLFVSEFDF